MSWSTYQAAVTRTAKRIRERVQVAVSNGDLNLDGEIFTGQYQNAGGPDAILHLSHCRELPDYVEPGKGALMSLTDALETDNWCHCMLELGVNRGTPRSGVPGIPLSGVPSTLKGFIDWLVLFERNNPISESGDFPTSFAPGALEHLSARIADIEEAITRCETSPMAAPLVVKLKAQLAEREKQFMTVAETAEATAWLLHECSILVSPRARFKSGSQNALLTKVEELRKKERELLVGTEEVVIFWDKAEFNPSLWNADSVEGLALRRWRVGSSDLYAVPLVAAEALFGSYHPAASTLTARMPTKETLEAVSVLFDPTCESDIYWDLGATLAAAEAL